MQVEAGQLVMYDPGYKVEIGKVKRINPYDPSKALFGITKEIPQHVPIWMKACGTDTPAYKNLSRKVFSECWHYLFDEFKVTQVAEIPYIKAEVALEYVNTWYPKPKTAQRIKQLNECV